tara:strand:- start:1803 stop:5396 length:3594 start_codon:yes stop_codon:yes gene_type:complete
MAKKNKKKYSHGGPHDSNLAKVKKGLRYVESSDGAQMINPKSSATGLYGQLYGAEELQYMPYLQGIDRQSFASDTTLQNKLFEDRYYGNIPKVPGLKGNAEDLRIEYKPQLAKKGIPFNYTDDEISALSNLLGRQGTREYLGYVLRDGRSLADVFPKIYGPDAEAPNKTPEKYLESYRIGRDLKYGGQVRSYADGGLYNFSTVEPTTNIGNWAGDDGANFAPQSPANVPAGEVPHEIESGDYQGELGNFKGWYGNYMLSDKYKQRLTSSGDYGSEEEIDALIKQRYGAMQDVTMNVTDKTDPHMGDSSFMKTSDNKMTLNTTRKDPDNKAATIAHEVGHAIGGDYDQYSFQGDRKGRGYRDQKAISPNDIRDLENRNTIYRNSPNRSINNGDVFENDEFVKDFNLNPNYPTVTTVRQGSPSIKPTKNDPYSKGYNSYNGSPEDYIRDSYTFPEGYPEEAKEREISRMVGEYEVDAERARNFKSAKDSNSLAKENISKSLSGDYSDLSMKDRIQLQKESYEENANFIVGSKELKKKYRGMSLEEIPDGVSPEIDSYRDFLKLENKYNTSSKNLKTISKSPYGDTDPREFTPQGGNQQVYKENTQHEIGGAESYSDVVGMRSYLYNNYGVSPENDITPEQYQEIMNDKNAPKHLIPNRFKKKYATPEDATYILNNIAMESPETGEAVNAKYGGNMKKYKNGGDPPKKKPAQLQFDPTSMFNPYGDPTYSLEEYNTAITRDSTNLEEALSPGLIAQMFGMDEAILPSDYADKLGRKLLTNRVNRNILKPYSEKELQDINYRKYGGKSMDVDYEAEGGEVVIGNIAVNKAYNGGIARQYKGSNMFKLEGPSHANGGIGITMQTGGKAGMNYMRMGGNNETSYVFSDAIGKKGNTFADRASKFGNKLDNINTMAMGGEISDRNTAERMGPRLMSKVKDLFNEQEDFKVKNNIDQDPNKMIVGGLAAKFGATALGKLGASAGLTPGLTAAQFLPGAINVAKGLFGKAPEMNLERVVPEMQEYEDFTGLQDTYMNQQDRSLYGLRKGLEGSGATGSQIRGNLQAGLSSSQNNAGQFFSQVGQMQSQSNRQTDNLNYQRGIQADQMNSQMDAMEDQFAAQNDPTQAFSQGLSQLIGTGTGMAKEGFNRKMMGQMFGIMGGGNSSTSNSPTFTPNSGYMGESPGLGLDTSLFGRFGGRMSRSKRLK